MRIVKVLLVLIILITGLASCTEEPKDHIDLSGNWTVRLDDISAAPQTIALPGTTDLAGIGVPNALEPELTKPQLLHLTRKNSFVGKAYYTREIKVSEEMAGKTLDLKLERVLWSSTLYIDGKEIGQPEISLVTPHHHIIADGLSAGKHEIMLCIDNTKLLDISVDDLCHSYTEATQIMWNGVLGEMSLAVVPEVNIDHVEVYSDVAARQIEVHTYINNVDAELTYELDGQHITVSEESSMDDYVAAVFDLPENVSAWNEFNTELHNFTVKTADIEKTVSFGLRELENRDGKLCVNGQPVFLRGTLECCIFPLTGNPPTDDAGWEKVIGTAKEWGLNHLRFHSWCPPDAAFRVADRMGFYLSVELPIWSLKVGADPAVMKFMEDEYEQIVRNYGNHPSFFMLSCGNELQYDFDFLNGLVERMKLRDRRHMYITTSFTFEKGHGGHNEPQDEYYVTQWTDNGWVRGQGVFDEEAPSFDKNYNSAMGCIGVPLISHEIGQYSVYPDMKEIDQYTGTLLPLNFMAIRNDLEKKGLIDKAEEWFQSSGHLAAILYKEECERAMKTQGFSGYQLLGLQDFPGQGTALIGLVNAFWESKHIVEADWFRMFCAPIVPLANFPKAVWSTSETFEADVQVANYSVTHLADSKINWKITDASGSIVADGTIDAEDIPNGDVYNIGSVSASLCSIEKAQQLTVSLEIAETEWHNMWNIWVYPEIEMPEDLNVTDDVEVALARLEAGETVLLTPRLGSLNGLEGKYLPVFWSPVHFPKQAGTMGILCDPEHPALADFPTEYWGDWQWWRLAKRSTVLLMDNIARVKPIVEQVDNFVNNRRLATMFEAKCGKGRLIFSAVDLLSEGADSPEVRQMLYSLEKYMMSDKFAPEAEISAEEIRSLFKDNNEVVTSKATEIYN